MLLGGEGNVHALLSYATLNDQHVFTPRLIRLVVSYRLAKRDSHRLLVKLCQLTAKCNSTPLAKRRRHIRKRRTQLVRCLVEYHRALLVFQGGKPLLSVPLLCGKKSLEAKTHRRQTGKSQRTHRRTAAGYNPHLNSRRGTQCHNVLTGVGNDRHSRIRNQRPRLTGQKPCHKPRTAFLTVVLVIAYKLVFYLIDRKQPCRIPRVLCRNEINLGKDLFRPLRYVCQVADRRRHKVKDTALNLIFLIRCHITFCRSPWERLRFP